MNILILGSTGLIGAHVLNICCEDHFFSTVRTLVRRSQNAINSKHQIHVNEMSQLETAADAFSVDVVVCALGTTIKKAGSKDAFKKVDLDLVVNCANMAKKSGVKHYVVVSSLGAKSDSANFYLNIKGQMEESLKTLAFEKLSIVRPSLLLGKRNDFRFGEYIGGKVFPLMNLLLHHNFKKYRAIQGEDVAKAIVHIIKDQGTYEPLEVKTYIKSEC